PKLDAASIVISYVLQPPGATAHVTIGILQGSQRIATLFDGEQVGSDAPRVLNWDGHLPAGVRVTQGGYVDPGDYQIDLVAGAANLAHVALPLSIVRLGITAIAAQPTSGNDEWPMVYFRKGNSYDFYATPSIHQYYNVARTGELSDLDLDSGEPRPVA